MDEKMNTIGKKKTNFTIPAIVPLIAGMIFIFQRALLSGTAWPSYGDSPKRYILFMSMKAIAAISMSLIPLWIGYHRESFERFHPLEKIGKMWIVYVIQMVFIFIFFYVVRKSLNIKNLWIILFPVSKTHYVFAVGLVLAFLLSPFVIQYLKKLSDKRFIQVMILLTFAAVIIPTIFGKDVWNFSNGTSFLWQLYLICVGYSLSRIGTLKRKLYLPIHLLVSVAILVVAIFIMAKLSMVVRGDVSTAGRFSQPYSIIGFYFGLVLFLMLEKIQAKVKLALPARLLMVYLVTTQIIATNAQVTSNINSYYRYPMEASVVAWILNIFKFAAMLYGMALISGAVIALLTRLPFIRMFGEKLAIHNSDELFERLENIWIWIKSRKRLFITIASYYVLILAQFFIVALATSKTPKHLFLQKFVTSQPQIWLSVAIMMAFLVLIFLITNRFWYAASFTVIVSILLTISSYLKLVLREEPVLPADFEMLSSIGAIIGMIQPTLIIIGVIAIVIIAFASWLLQHHTRQKYNLKVGFKKRIIGIVAILAMFSGVFFLNHRDTPPNLLFRLFNVNPYFFAQITGVQSNGPLIQFLNNIDVKVMDKPAGYSKSKVQEVMKRYDEKAAQINEERSNWDKNQTVIFNLSESFSDPSRVPETKVSADPIPNIRAIKEGNTSGLMLSTGYGGGTANIEWETLTGLTLGNLAPTLVTPYSMLVEDQEKAPNFTELFDKKIVIHPYRAHLYNRINVFKKFGVDAFYYIGSQDKLTYQDKIEGAKYISDDSAYKEVLKHINENSDGTQFIQLSSMQNHSPYTVPYPETDFDFVGPSVAVGDHKQLQNYMQGIHYTDAAVHQFIKELDKIEKPITFVFYGDHLPGLYSGLNKDKYGREMRETDYFVYNNKYSREHSKYNMDYISPNYFPAMALKQAGVKITAYYALMTELLEKVPAMTNNPKSSTNNKFNGGQVFVTSDGKMVEESELTKEQQSLMDDYRMIQYDLTAGNQYSADWASQKVDPNI